jgi:DNA-binding CsgD family transcriptional regulator
MIENCQSLTHSERACLQSVALGTSVDAIARKTGESPEQIEALLASARRKLAATTTVEAVARALNLGLIE